MKSTVRNVWGLMAVAVLLCLATSAFAGTVSLQINDPPSNNILDGIYVGAYSATNIGTGAQTQIICDDFKDDSNYNQATYTVHNISNAGLIGTVWGLGAMNQYDEAAWLTLGMLKQTGVEQGYYSYASLGPL